MLPKLAVFLLAAGLCLPARRAAAQAPPATSPYRRPLQYAVLYVTSGGGVDRPTDAAHLELQYGLSTGRTDAEAAHLREVAARVKTFTAVADALDYLSAQGWDYLDSTTDVVRDRYLQRYVLCCPL